MTSFDARAKHWDADPVKVERALAAAAAIEASVSLQPSMRLLEYGCGTGLLGFALRPRVGDVTLCDVSKGMLAVVDEKLAAAPDPHVHPLALDLSTEPAPQLRYDVVCSLMTLHHIPDTADILHKFNVLLARPGFLCVVDLDAEDGSFHGHGFEGHNGFDRDELGAKAWRAGFDTVRFVTAYQMKKAVDGAMRSFPVFLMVAEKR